MGCPFPVYQDFSIYVPSLNVEIFDLGVCDSRNPWGVLQNPLHAFHGILLSELKTWFSLLLFFEKKHRGYDRMSFLLSTGLENVRSKPEMSIFAL